jgi:ankyrin repeat protein
MEWVPGTTLAVDGVGGSPRGNALASDAASALAVDVLELELESVRRRLRDAKQRAASDAEQLERAAQRKLAALPKVTAGARRAAAAAAVQQQKRRRLRAREPADLADFAALDLALFDAAEAGDADFAEAALAAGADVNFAHRLGRMSPLFAAALRGGAHRHQLVVATLLAAGADPDGADENGRTPLFVAVECGHARAVGLLLDAGASPDLAPTSGLQPTRSHVVQYSAASHTPLYTAVREWGSGWAHLRATYGDITRRLLDAGAAVGTTCGTAGWTALHLAAVHGASEAVELLLRAGAQPEVECAPSPSDYYGPCTPLMLAACEQKSMKVVLQLLEAGADPHRPNVDGETALTRVAQQMDEGLVGHLLRNPPPSLVARTPLPAATSPERGSYAARFLTAAGEWVDHSTAFPPQAAVQDLIEQNAPGASLPLPVPAPISSSTYSNGATFSNTWLVGYLQQPSKSKY